MDPPPNPNPNPTDAQPQAEAGARLAALSLRGGRDLPPDFEIHEHHLDDDDDDDEGYLTAASRGGSSTCAWKGLRDDDRDGDDVSPPSPSSSGYAGERGSSLDDDPEPEPDPEPAQDWPRDKKHLDEDDASSSWRKRKKHFFILSNSGKPIYSRYGDEHKLAGFSATLQAIISFVENSGDHIKFVRSGKHQIVFLVKGPIYLVCISCTEESYEGLRGQLELMYGQLLLILTKSVNRCFEKNPKFDMAPLLGGTDAVFLSLIHAFSWNPATFLHAYTCLPLAQSTRQAASAVLQDVADSGVLFALLMCEHKVISLVGAQKATLHPDDILLLANFILSSESFRTSESFSPICLPRYNPMAFLYAYVHFFDEHTFATLLTTRSDAFYDLKDSRARIQNVLLKSNVLPEVQRSLHESALHVEDLPIDPSSQSASQPPQSSRDMSSQSLSSEMAIGGPAGLWHFIYKSVYLDQHTGLTRLLFPLQNALYFLYIAIGVFFAGWIEVSCWILTGERQTAVIRSKYVQVLLNQDMSFFDTYGNNGDIVSQVLSDVLLIQSALSEKVGNYIHNMATFFGGLVIGLVNCWQIALLTLATGPFIVAAGGISNIFLHRLAENIQDAYGEAASIAEQAILYIRTLYSFTNETLAKYSYATSLQATLRYGILISLVQGLGLGFTYGLAICSCALQLWVGRFLISHGRANGGEVVVALFAIILSGLGLNQAATNFYSFEQGRIAAYRLYEMISRSTSTVNQDGRTLSSVQGNIEFRNVYFSYLSRPEIPILSGFYLTVPARKTVALVGRNGSGKSSIIPLMERFYDPTLGEVLLDGENIKNLKLEWLRSQIGLVTQEPALLSLSIRENIAYGRSATTDQIEEAAKTAHVHAFISSLEKGYETQVGRAGLSLTEEQKIKLSIARAVLSNPSILLLDEVTGALDFEAEKAVQEALDILMLGRSTIIIARRLSLIRNADYIAVMEEGQLVEMGTHEELLNLDGLYAELLRCEEAAKLPKRTPIRNYKEPSSFQIERDSSASHSFQESSSPNMSKSPSLQKTHGFLTFRNSDANHNSHESPNIQSPPSEQMAEARLPMVASERAPSTKRQDSFEMKLPDLPKIDVPLHRQSSNTSDPESPISPLLTSDPKNERSHSKTFSRPLDIFDSFHTEDSKKPQTKAPSFWRLAELSLAEYFYALLGSAGAACFGSFNPLLAYTISLIVVAYYKIGVRDVHDEVNKYCSFIVGMGIITVLANFLQHFYFGIMGEKMTERVRRMMFSAILRNEVGWFDDEDNSADILSMRLANDATFVRAAFSNRLSIFIQDTSAIFVALLLGMLLQWRVALVALATLPILIISAVAQKMWLSGFSRGIQEMHRKASLVLEDAVRNIYTVVAFCAGNKIMELYRLQLGDILTKSFIHGMGIGFAFGFSQFLLFACNALLLWYTAAAVKDGHLSLVTALKEYIVFSFATFALVEPFGLAPYILKRRKSLTSVFEIIDRVPKIDPDDASGLKPPNVYGSIEFRNVDFCYPTRPEMTVLSNFSLRVNGGQTVAVVGVSGSGKSTIVSLIDRFYDPTAGQVLLDGRDLKLFNLRWLRSHMGLVPQDPVIFSTTIRENIIYARHNATESEMKEAARIANAHHFISSLPHGYDTHVGMRGVDLTPGQKQRIAIARVVLKNAPILLLDEASSAIESESSRVVQEALDTLIMGNKTTVLIAHKAAMMKHVDNIVVLNGGRIVEQGSHDSLVQLNGLYVKLMQPHFSKGFRQRRLI